MSLKTYFQRLIDRVEQSEEIHNGGKDEGGFYKPVRTILLRHLKLLRDLHEKPHAREMVQSSWEKVVEVVPGEWLEPLPDEENELKKLLKE